MLLWLFVGCFSADAFVVNLSYLGTALFNFNSLMNWYLEALFCCFYSPIGGTIAQFFFPFTWVHWLYLRASTFHSLQPLPEVSRVPSLLLLLPLGLVVPCCCQLCCGCWCCCSPWHHHQRISGKYINNYHPLSNTQFLLLSLSLFSFVPKSENTFWFSNKLLYLDWLVKFVVSFR